MAANALCVTGLSLIGYALWWLHPAACLGFVGAGLTLLGVRIHRTRKPEAKAEPK
jgi:hypothetical protein